jgi:hypothetical protein
MPVIFGMAGGKIVGPEFRLACTDNLVCADIGIRRQKIGIRNRKSSFFIGQRWVGKNI